MTDLPDPMSRRDRQRQTRDAIVFAAREAFAEGGYHAANLEAIARRAGFSKGAVYSNFAGKAELFLAVIDANIEQSLAQGGWDVFETPDEWNSEDPRIRDAIRGFALATLEFIAVAARDDKLSEAMAARMNVLVATYAGVVEASRVQDDDLTSEQLGALLAALDQGAAALSLAGSHAIDQSLLRAGMLRLLDPSQAGEPERGDGESALHDRVIRARVAAALREAYRE